MTIRSCLFLLTIILSFASGLSAAQLSKLPESLAGKHWKFVNFQSMDDNVGTLQPDDSAKYTIQLDGDGTVVMRLNCNRATKKKRPRNWRVVVNDTLRLREAPSTRARIITGLANGTPLDNFWCKGLLLLAIR